MTRRRWDYLVRYLAGATPPVEYEMKPWKEVQAINRSGPSSQDVTENDSQDNLEP